MNWFMHSWIGSELIDSLVRALSNSLLKFLRWRNSWIFSNKKHKQIYAFFSKVCFFSFFSYNHNNQKNKLFLKHKRLFLCCYSPLQLFAVWQTRKQNFFFFLCYQPENNTKILKKTTTKNCFVFSVGIIQRCQKQKH